MVDHLLMVQCVVRSIPRGGPIELFVVPASQVRSECLMFTFRASCCEARLSRAQVPAGSSVQDRGKKGDGVRGDHLHWRLQGSMSSLTGIGSRWRVFKVLWNLECPVGLSQREICVHFNEGNLAQFGWSAKK